jgi:hypothetical protein
MNSLVTFAWLIVTSHMSMRIATHGNVATLQAYGQTPCQAFEDLQKFKPGPRAHEARIRRMPCYLDFQWYFFSWALEGKKSTDF